MRYQSGGAKFVGLGFFSSRSGLNGVDHHPRPITYWFFLLFGLGFTLSILFLFVYLLLFWLGSAVDHRSHTPITTPFQYAGAVEHRQKEAEKVRETEY